MINLKSLFIGLLVSLTVAVGAVSADTLTLRPDHPTRYVVVKGDTLWDISARFLKDPWLWPKIWRINPQIDNPNLIYPGDVIVLRYDHGRPVVQVERGRHTVKLSPYANTVKLSPHARTSPIEEAVPTIPVDAIHQFLMHPLVLSKKDIKRAGYVVAGDEDRLITGAADTIYARSLPEKQATEYDIYRIGDAYRDPDSGDLLGYEALRVATAKVVEHGDPSTLVISTSNRETLVGDRLLPAQPHSIERYFQPHAPAHKVTGRIIAVLDGVSRIGQYQTVVLNLGADKGMAQGDVLAVYQKGETVHDAVEGGKVTLPDQRAGLAMVVKTFDHVSYALVMEAEKDMRVLDSVRNP